MGDDWDSEPSAKSAKVPKAKDLAFNDEDIEEAPVENWDDEPAPAEDKPAPVLKPKALSKKKLEAKRAAELAKREAEEREREEAVKADPKAAAAEKKKKQKIIEDADNDAMYDLLGVAKPAEEEKPAPAAEEKSKKTVSSAAADVPVALGLAAADVVLKTDADYDKYADTVATKIGRKGEATRQLRFLTSLIKKATVNMKLEDINQLKTSLTIIYNDKNKAEQNKKKKGGGGKMSLKMGAGDRTAVYDDRADDFDF